MKTQDNYINKAEVSFISGYIVEDVGNRLNMGGKKPSDKFVNPGRLFPHDKTKRRRFHNSSVPVVGVEENNRAKLETRDPGHSASVVVNFDVSRK